MPVSFEELEGSPRLAVREEGASAVRTFRVAWNDWPAFARELVGSYRLVGGAYHFVEPLSFPGMPNMVVDELEVRPFGPTAPDGSQVSSLVSGTNRYPTGGASVRATYVTQFDRNNLPRADLPSVPKATYLTFRADLGVEYLSVPARVWHWDDAPLNTPLPPDASPGILVPQSRFELIWHRVPLPPWSKIRELRGKVNDAAFLGAPAGTVLFLGARIYRQFQFIENGGYWRVAYAFQENTKELSTGSKVGWNYYYKESAVSGEHWVAIRDNDGNLPYESGSLTQLFQFGT
jgi:hypothetical protein